MMVAALLVAAGCGGDGDDNGPTATIAKPGKTSTTEAKTPEEQVEAAYLKSWDVYAKAARSLDAAGLDSWYADRALEIVLDDIAKFARNNTPARFEIEHHYRIEVDESGLAVVRDDYINHSVLLDASTGEPIEPDPNEAVAEIYLMKKVDGRWKVTNIQSPPS
jgi:hypothetical protein